MKSLVVACVVLVGSGPALADPYFCVLPKECVGFESDKYDEKSNTITVVCKIASGTRAFTSSVGLVHMYDKAKNQYEAAPRIPSSFAFYAGNDSSNPLCTRRGG